VWLQLCICSASHVARPATDHSACSHPGPAHCTQVLNLEACHGKCVSVATCITVIVLLLPVMETLWQLRTLGSKQRLVEAWA